MAKCKEKRINPYQRHSPRYKNDHVSISVFSPTQNKFIKTNILDLSKQGLAFSSQETFQASQPLMLEIKDENNNKGFQVNSKII
ncbi:MAG: PilZ domain-containing protein [bacterium]|nr:PilZ domain-containing protein [bacterium]